MSVPIPDCGKGVIKDLLPSDLELGYWSDCSNFRFRNGFAEKFDGSSTSVTPSTPPYWALPYAIPTELYLAYSGLTKAYVYAASTQAHTEITRYTTGAAIASITRAGTTATLTTSANHGRTTGDTVTVYGALPSQYNATAVITVTGVTTFTYVMASDPGASASKVGAYSYNVTSNFTGTSYDRPTGGVLNGIMVYNHPVDGFYYWNGDLAIRLRKFPASYTADVGKPFGKFLIQLAPTISGVKYPHDVIWSSSAEPGAIPTSFDASATNDAGRSPEMAATPGVLVDCLSLNETLIVYKQDARYAMRYIGGNDVFSITKLPGNDGLLARQCAVDTPNGHVFLTQSFDVMIHQGGAAKSIVDGRIKNWLTSYFVAFTPSGNKVPFLATYPGKNEVWVCFPTAGGLCDRFAVWNWESDTWGIFYMPTRPLSYAVTGLFTVNSSLVDPRNTLLVCCPAETTIGALDGSAFSSTFLGATVTGTLERTGIHLDSRDYLKSIQRSRWNFDKQNSGAATATISHGSSTTADGTVTYATGATYTLGTTDFADGRATSARFGAIKLSTTNNIAVRSIDLDVTGGGTR